MQFSHNLAGGGAFQSEYVPDGHAGSNDHYQGSRGYHRNSERSHRTQSKDRPRKAQPIPSCSPWLLVQTKLGRRFVHNPDTRESFWKFPPDVLRAVTNFDRVQREQRSKGEVGLAGNGEVSSSAAAEADDDSNVDNGIGNSALPNGSKGELDSRLVGSDGEEYEEVEVTDEEEDDHSSKRQKTAENEIHRPVEFDEDDIAYQLAAMGEDYGLDPGEYGGDEFGELAEGAEGLELTEEDSKALFKDMLSDFQINPYDTWESVVEAGHIIEDDRYTVVPNMKARRSVWDEWSRDSIQQLKRRRETEQKMDPKIPYFAFLQKHATPKLYWPEFRRKFKKEPELHHSKLLDKDREKWYRDYINRLKLPENQLKSDLVALLKTTPLKALNRSTSLDTMPSSILTDLRYISLRSAVRDPLIEAHISTLASTLPEALIADEAQVGEREERERRQRALAERQARVQDEKRKQERALQSSRSMLKAGEQEVREAMNVGKEGLLGHYGE